MRESIRFDVVIVGAGPAGLSAAIRIKQIAQAENRDISVCILEKGAEVGAHILSGCVFEPRALNELLPDWKSMSAPISEAQAVTQDHFLWLSNARATRLPTPSAMHNRGNYIVSLGEVCKWLAEIAMGMGVEIFAGFAASRLITDNHDQVIGVATGDMGVSKQGGKKDNFQEGVDILASYTLLAEGCRGSLSEQAMKRYHLRKPGTHGTYAIGVKEIWELDPRKHVPGKVIHSIGWPLDSKTYGGSFAYHAKDNLLYIGLVIGLDYQNPYLSPFKEMQRLKTHPYFRELLKGARRISYGARALNEGGMQSLPRLDFPGGALIGCSAGFVNVPKIKGSHTAMKSGMLAAEAVCKALKEAATLTDANAPTPSLAPYDQALRQSWVYQELHLARNIRPAFRYGLLAGVAYAAIDSYILRGRAPWTFSHGAPDHACLQKADKFEPITYPAPDGTLTFDLLSSVQLTNTNHEEDQPVHLQLENPELAVEVNLEEYDSPESRYCPAGVYEIVTDDATEYAYLQINAQNCIHCKTCDIKDPCQNINWTTPEGSGGPRYSSM